MFQVHIPKAEQHGNVKKYLIDPFSSKTKDFDILVDKATGTKEKKQPENFKEP